jgi:D-alanyl-D-alanine carboxypeptidase
MSRLSVFLATLCLACAFAALPAGANDSARLAKLLPKGARWALVILDRESGRERLAWGNALTGHLVPGSLVKLVTTGAVLDAVEKGEATQEALIGPVRTRRHGGEAVSADAARLDSFLRQMNVHSVNSMAEHLFLHLGEQRYGPPATEEKGSRAIAAYLASLDLPKGGLIVVDGSGLSRQDRFAPRALARYLREITHRHWFPRLANSLPHPGIEGTVKRIGYADRRFRVKSGRLDDVFSLAGYGVDRNGRELVFVFLVNLPFRESDRWHCRGYVVRLLAHGELPE